jgi:fermentation-respiration switch protein FrsA (DUF1100 family)
MRTRTVIALVATVVVATLGAPAGMATSKVGPPGTLIFQRPLGNLEPDLSSTVSSATYIRYQSTSPTGQPIEVSGAVFLPTGDAPVGGWPVIAFAHGTSGVVSACAPTNSPTLFGSAPTVEQLLAGHRAVVMTNYQGLDGPRNAPYLDTPSSGYDVLDSVRAAHDTGLPLASDTVLVGASQGGRAAESAAETAKSHAPELNIRGVVLLSPALEIEFADAVHARALNEPAQYLIVPYLLAAVRYHDPGYGYGQVLHGNLLTAAPQLESTCTGDLTPADAAIGTSATPDEARFVDDAAAQTFLNFETRTNLPQSATSLPTYIVRGDADHLVSTAWSTEAVGKMCALGTPVHDVVVPGDHDAPDHVSDQWLAWVGDLFAGTPIATTCPR